MPNYEWIEKKGKKIFYMNIASRDLTELENKIKEFRAIIDKQPKGSMLTITDTTNGFFNNKMNNALTMFAKDNNAYVKMTVLIGVEGLKKVLYQSILLLSGRKNIVVKKTKEEAIEFLAAL